MNNFVLTLTADELQDIRMAVIAKLLDAEACDRYRLSSLSDKLARASVVGHA